MEDYSNISVKKSKVPNETAEIANFHFSHYKTKETLSCLSNESSWTLTIKKINFVDGNVLIIYAKFQLHPHVCWEEDF